jgi:hypothetical protein
VAATHGWSAGIGRLLLSYIGFAPPAAGAQASLVLMLCVSETLVAGDLLEVVLPAFQLNVSGAYFFDSVYIFDSVDQGSGGDGLKTKGAAM